MWSVWLLFCDCGFHSVCSLMEKDKRLMEASCWEDWLWGKLGLVLMDGAMLIKSLIQYSVAGQGCVPSLLFDLRPNYGGGSEDNGDLLQKAPCKHCYTQSSQPWSRPLLTCTSTGDTQTQFCLSLCGISGSWCAQGLFELSESLWQVWGLILNVNSPRLPSCWGFSFAFGHRVSPQEYVKLYVVALFI